MSLIAERDINECDVKKATTCVADALDNYADALRQLAPRMPSELRELPNVVARAAKQVRIAKTKGQALSAVRNAVAEVHKAIALLRADDPITLSAGTREGAFVVETLQYADDKLEKAVGL
jgi:hypothetical protein